MGQTLQWEISVNSSGVRSAGCAWSFARDALEMDDIPTVKDAARCIGCLMCEMHCPDFAITVKRRDSNG